MNAATNSSHTIVATVHVYYEDVWAKLKSYLLNLPKDTEFYFNVGASPHASKLSSEIKSSFPNSNLIISSNIGRDIGGLFHLIQAFKPRGEYWLHLHTKKSSYTQDGEMWFDDLISSLLDSREIFLRNLELLKSPAIGMVGAEGCISDLYGANEDLCRMICDQLNIPFQRSKFIAGTMFMTRGELLRKISELKIDMSIFEENGARDGTFAHAFERIFGILVNSLQLKIAGVQGNQKYNHQYLSSLPKEK